jgi:hypothetical protein
MGPPPLTWTGKKKLPIAAGLLQVGIARRQRFIATDKQTTNHDMDRGSY